MNQSYIKSNNEVAGIQYTFMDLIYAVCKYSCIVLIVYYCWYVEAFGNFSLVVNGSFLIMSGCIFLIHLVDAEIRFKEIPYGIWNKVIMIIYTIVPGLLIAYDRSTLLNAIKHYIIFFLITYAFVLVSNYYNSYDWIMNAIISAILIDCFHLVLFGYHYSATRIVLSSNSNPNYLVTLLNLGLFCVLFKTSFTFASLVKSIPISALIFYNVIMAGSRKGLLASLMLFAFWGLSTLVQIHRKGSTRQILVLWAFIIFIIIVFSYVFINIIANAEVMTRMKTMRHEKSNSARIDMYIKALRIFLNKPIFGGGLDQYQHWSGTGGYSHSTYAEAIADFGFVGTVLYFAPFIYTIYTLLTMIINDHQLFYSMFLLGFCLIELFLGAVQVWFLEAGHIITWAIIFICTQKIYYSNSGMRYMKTNVKVYNRTRSKYVKY